MCSAFRDLLIFSWFVLNKVWDGVRMLHIFESLCGEFKKLSKKLLGFGFLVAGSGVID